MVSLSCRLWWLQQKPPLWKPTPQPTVSLTVRNALITHPRRQLNNVFSITGIRIVFSLPLWCFLFLPSPTSPRFKVLWGHHGPLWWACNTFGVVESLSSAYNTILVMLLMYALCLNNRGIVRLMNVQQCLKNHGSLFRNAVVPSSTSPPKSIVVLWIAQPYTTLPIHSTNGQTSDGTKPRRGDTDTS